MKRGTGMTLIELLVSLSIGTVVVAAVLGVLASARRTQLAGEMRSDVFQSVRVTLSQIERDLQVAVLREDDERYQFTGSDGEIDDIPVDSVEFASMSGSPLSSLLPTGDLVRVQYYIDLDDATDRMGLVRCELPMPLPDKITAEQQDVMTREYCPWAVALEIAYYDPDEESWVEDWEERTDLPAAVQLTLYVLPEALDDEAEADITDLIPFQQTVQLALVDAPIGTGQVDQTTETGTEGEPGMEGAG